MEDEFFNKKSTKTVVSEISRLVICKALARKETREFKHKSRKSIKLETNHQKKHSRNHINPSGEAPKNHHSKLMKTKETQNKYNFKVTAVQKPDQENNSPKVMTSASNSMLFFSQSIKGLNSSSSLNVDDDKKMEFFWQNLGYSHDFHDEIITQQKDNTLNMVNHRERKKDRSKTIQPIKSTLNVAEEENN